MPTCYRQTSKAYFAGLCTRIWFASECMSSYHMARILNPSQCWSLNWHNTSVGTVLIFQFSPGFGTEASVPAISWYRFWHLGSGSLISKPGFRYKVFRGLFAFVSFRYCFGSISVSFWPQIRWNLKLWYWNLNWLEPKLLKNFGTKIKKLRFFRYFRFQTNTT